MYCGEMGRSPFELFADWLSGSQLRGFAQWAEQESFLLTLAERLSALRQKYGTLAIMMMSSRPLTIAAQR